MAVASTFVTTGSAVAQTAGVQARSADSFVDSIGVNTHWHYNGTPYKDAAAKAQDLLVDSGIRHQRDYPFNMSAITSLASRGVKTSAIIPHPDQGSWAQTIWGVAFDNISKAPGAFSIIEGTNEPDITMGSDWPTKMRSHQQTIWDRVKGDSKLKHLPVAGPSMTWAHNTPALGDISAWADLGNMHPYPGGRTPDKRISEDIAASQKNNVGPKPVIATETGYHNMVPSNTGHRGTSEQAEAVYMPRLYLHYFDIGVPRTYSYEFIDQKSTVHAEHRFGMVRHDLTPKPVYHALKNLIGLLSDPGPAFSPGRLDYKVTNGDSATRHVLFQKRDGSFWVALWQETSVWDEANGTTLDPADRRVKLTLPSSSTVNLYIPNSSASPVKTASGVSSVEVDSAERVTLVEIRSDGMAEPTGTTTTTAPTTTTTEPAPSEPAPTTDGSTTERTSSSSANLFDAASATLDGAADVTKTAWQHRSTGGTSGPVLTADPSLVISGSKSLLRTKDGSKANNWDVWQSSVHGSTTLPVTAGTRYTFRADVRLPDAPSTVRAVIEWLDGSGNLVRSGTVVGSRTSVGATPTLVSATGTAPSSAVAARVFHRVESIAASARVIGDRFSFHAGDDSAFPSSEASTTPEPTEEAAPTPETTTTTAPPATTTTTAPPATTTTTAPPPSATSTNLLNGASASLDPAVSLADTVWQRRSAGATSDPVLTSSSSLVISGTKSMVRTKDGQSAKNWDPWQSSVHGGAALPVQAGVNYTFRADLRLPDSASSMRAVIEWLDSSGRLISGTVVGPSTNVGSGTQVVAASGKAPSGAVAARVFHRVESIAGNARVVGDNFTFHAG